MLKTKGSFYFIFDIDDIPRIVYSPGVQLTAMKRAKEGVMDVQARTNPSVDRLAVIPPILPLMFSKKGFRHSTLFLSGDHFNFTSFDYKYQANLLGLDRFLKEKEVVMDLPTQIIPSLVRSAAFPSYFKSCFPAKGCQQSTFFFSLVFIVILLPFTTWIKQTCLVILAEQRGLDGSPIIFFPSPPLLENMRVSKGVEAS